MSEPTTREQLEAQFSEGSVAFALTRIVDALACEPGSPVKLMVPCPGCEKDESDITDRSGITGEQYACPMCLDTGLVPAMGALVIREEKK